MAEAVGLAASIAGLVGLAGQLLQGGLFIQQFFEDVRGAPVEVLDLRDELQLFAFVANDTKSLLQQACDTTISIDTSNTTRTFERCERVVKEIGNKLTQYAGNMEQDKKLWWKRIKVASRKKALADYLRRLERAKGQLLVVQSNLTQSFLLGQQKALQEANKSLAATNAIVGHIHSQGTTLARNVDRLNREFNSSLVDISRNLKPYQHTAEVISTTISNINSLADQGNGDSSLAGQNYTFCGISQELLHSEDFVSDAQRTPINVKTTHAETILNTKVAVATRQIRSSRAQGMSPAGLERRETILGRAYYVDHNTRSTTWDSCTTETQRSGQNANTPVGRRFDLWLFRIDWETRCGKPRDSHAPQNEDIVPMYSSVTRVSIRASFRIPFFRRNVFVKCEASSDSGFDMQLRVHNIVPRDSPIFEACRTLDLPAAQELLQTKSASPFDFRTTSGGNVLSLIDEVFRGFVKFSIEADFAKIDQGLHLLQYLLPIFHDVSQILNYEQFAIELVHLIANSDDRSALALVDVVRIILIESEHIPFESTELQFTYLFINLETLGSPLSKLLLEQSYQGIDTRELQTNIWNYEFWENDRLMLTDLEGRNMKAAVREGRKYRISVLRTYDSKGHKIWDFIDEGSEMIYLLQLAHESYNPDFVLCCRNRLAFLIQLEYDLEEYYLKDVDEILSRTLVRLPTGCVWVSLVDYVLQHNMWDFFTDILAQADCSQAEIANLLDKELYAGIPELLDGRMEYQTRGSQRKSFVSGLIEGQLMYILPDDVFEMGFEPEGLSSVSFQHAIYTGTDYEEMKRVIREANSSFRQKLTPGSWNDDVPVRLVPGVDFEAFIHNTNGTEKMDMRDWLVFEDD